MRFHAEGTFVIDSWEKLDAAPPPGTEAGEFTGAAFTRTYSGDFTGSGRCQSVTSSTGPGHAGRVGIEIFEGTVQGRTGQCSITHRTHASMPGAPWRYWTIGSGKGGLAGIQGQGEIVMTDERKSYSFDYDFDAPPEPKEPEAEVPRPKKHRKRFWAP